MTELVFQDPWSAVPVEKVVHLIEREGLWSSEVAARFPPRSARSLREALAGIGLSASELHKAYIKNRTHIRCPCCKLLKPISEKKASNPYCTSCARIKSNLKYKRVCGDAELRRKYKLSVLLRKYGLAIGDYERLRETQGHVCAICRKPETAKTCRGELITDLSVDHDHVSGRIRGLLCKRCNTLLGLCRDNPATLASAVTYLRKGTNENEAASAPVPAHQGA